MMLLGFKARYKGRYGDVPVTQAGPYKLIHLRDYTHVPLPLARLFVQAREAGAQFLVIDNRLEQSDNKATWVDIRQEAA